MTTTKKAPQDRKAPKGFYRIGKKDYELKPDLPEDYEFLELVREAESESPLAVIACLKYVFADAAGHDALKEACRENGRVSLERMTEHFQSIMEAAAPNS